MLATLATPVTAAADADGGFPAETEAEGNQVPGTKLTFDFVKFVSVDCHRNKTGRGLNFKTILPIQNLFHLCQTCQFVSSVGA